MRVTSRQARALGPYLIGQPKANGEWDMYCPLHDDVNKRSASLNVTTGDFFCHACDIGMGVTQLLSLRSQWVEVEAASRNGHHNGGARIGPRRTDVRETITEAMISAWHEVLMASTAEIELLMERRGLNEDTLRRFEIGWDRDRRVYTIPIRGWEGEIWNVRRYTFEPRDTKIWSVSGMRVTELYPVSILRDVKEGDEVVLGEGEWDVLLTIQNGHPAVTKTSGAKTWKSEWSEHFKGLRVWLGHDADFDGQAANRKIGRALLRIAKDVRALQLPYPVEPKHGKDLTDFWMEHEPEEFEQLKLTARGSTRESEQEPPVVTVLDSFDSHKVGEPVRLMVTIKGRKEPGYSVPKTIQLSCTRDAGPKCNFCPLKPAGGETRIEIIPSNPLILSMLDAPTGTINASIVSDYGVPGGKCPKLVVEIEDHQAVEILYARPSIDHSDGDVGTYKNVRITSVGRHDTLPNNTVIATGALRPNPRSQGNEFLAWSIERQETSVDRFVVTPEAVALMKRFQPRRGQRPLRKLSDINKELASHVTRIVGRPEMHALIDLTFHSLLGFKFGGTTENRGWLQSIIVGDTRTGKSAAASELVRHFGGGEIVGGEAASLAGLVGGLQQIGGKDWAVTWGVIPINDRRLVVIDEFPHPEDISRMSDVLSSGVAKLTKIEQDVTWARTRTLWIGNPPQTTMAHYTYGVDSFRSIINTPEDIARFDLAMAVSFGDVPSEDINRPIVTGDLRYTAEACHTMLMWCWTRKAEDVIWAKGAEDAVYAAANAMGKRYVEDPPLVQAANIRIKIARVAVALAARTFSTDDTHEHVVVTVEHVEDAVSFMDHIYALPAFGYAERSRERIDDMSEARRNQDDVRTYLLEHPQLARFLRSQAKFRRQDLEEILNYDRDLANGVISRLWNTRMVRKVGTADIFVEPVLHEILREVR